jgi:uncharacterized protein (UPF0332 family)
MSERMSKVEAQHYLKLATDDLRAASDTLRLGHLRVSVSRSYYAMFYAVTALLGRSGVWRSKHQGIIAAFGEHFVKPGLIEPEYGRTLNDAFHARLDSDYAPYPNLDLAAVEQLLQQAQAFVERLSVLLAELDNGEGEHATE